MCTVIGAGTFIISINVPWTYGSNCSKYIVQVELKTQKTTNMIGFYAREK